MAGVLVGLGLLAFGVYETDWLPAALGVATVTVSARLLLKPHPG